jgi:hypothetical protein
MELDGLGKSEILRQAQLPATITPRQDYRAKINCMPQSNFFKILITGGKL